MLQLPWLRRRSSLRPPNFRAKPHLEHLEDRCLLATLVGLTNTNTLVRFDSSAPGVLTNIATVTGVQAGQTLVDIAFQPETGNLYGLGFDSVGLGSGLGQIYQINPTDAIATAVGTPFSTKLNGSNFAFSFDPVSGNIRIVSNAEENLRVSPTSGALVSIDANINPPDDIAAVAYSNNLPGAAQTTLYGYDFTTNQIVTIGSINGSPNSPNSGIVSAIGASGISAQQAGNLGFSIDANGTAYVSAVVGGSDGLYVANLATGTVTSAGSFAGNLLRSISVAPAVSFAVSGYPTPRTQALGSVITVNAETVYNTVATGYAGTVAFSSSDPAAVLPANSTLTNGSSTFAVTLNTPGTQSITATDIVLNTTTGSQSNITVLPNTELVGLTPAGQLVRFNSETPGSITNVGTVTGLATGQSLVGIAFRPATGGLYGLGFGGGTGQLYTINPITAVATAVGAPFSTTISGQDFGFTFDPVQDIVRITSNDNENFEVNANTGALISKDATLMPTTANVTGIAYNNNFLGAATTTLYGYDSSDNELVTIGNVGGTPNAPSSGKVINVGPSNDTATVSTAGDVGFAIDANGAAYLDLVVGGNSSLFTVNLGTGTATLNGTFGTGIVMKQIAVAPAVSYSFGNLGSAHVAGAASPITVNAVDAYGNVAAGYQETVTFSSSDSAAVLPANSMLNNGVGSFSTTFNTVGAQSFTATDTGNSNITATASNIPVIVPVDLVGLEAGGVLVHFDSNLKTLTNVATITGLSAGQTIVAIDFRPANNQLYGLAFSTGLVQLYKIDPTNAVATAVGSPVSVSPADTSFSFGFDPVNDVARVISNTDENLRINPTTGVLIATDSSLTPSSDYVGVAYSNNFSGAAQTTLYSYDLLNNNLVTIGSFNGTPNSPNSGQVSVVGPSGVTADSTQPANDGFDIGSDGIGYLHLVTAGNNSGLYTTNLTTGAVSLIGTVSGTLEDITMAPAASFTVAGFPSPIAAGTPGTFTVTALDAYNEVVPSYHGTVTFDSTDPKAVLPANSTLTNGLGTFTATFNTVGTQSLTAVDTAAPTINGTQSGGIVVTGATSPPPPPGSPPPPPAISKVDRIGVVVAPPSIRTATAALDSNGDGTFDSGDAVFNFGLSTDKFVVGDWADIGFDSLGVVSATSSGVQQWVLDSNGDNVFDSGDFVTFYGLNSDTPVAGDWTGSGTSKIGVVRQTSSGVLQWVLNTSGSGVYSSSDASFFYGANGDTPVVGDWTGDGITNIGVVRQTSSGVLEWVLNTSGTGAYSSSDTVYFFGANGDIPVVGDWTGSGKTDIGVVVPQANGTALWVLDTSGTGVYTSSDTTYNYGLSSDRFIVGKWQLPAALYSGDGVLNASVQPLTANATFVSTIDQAIEAWQQAGLSPQLVSRLENVNYTIGTLGNGLLGETSGNTITIDATAQGHGWSESATPQPGQMDLFTALEHEMGHILGLPDQSTASSDLMFESLLPGVRKTPTTQDVDAVFAAMSR
jgi:Domain of unknown function (DUF4394)